MPSHTSQERKARGAGKKTKSFMQLGHLKGSANKILKMGHNQESAGVGNLQDCNSKCVESCCPGGACGAIRKRSCENRCALECL